MINIPFLIVKSGKGRTSGDSVSEREYDVQLAKSHLASELSVTTIVPDDQLLAEINNSPVLMPVWEEFGGTETTIPTEFKQLRKQYRAILFLDEYWRQTSGNVRNILRGILNGRIGRDRIPAGIFVIYASNMQDVSGSIEDIPKNADFKRMDFHPPSKEEFFKYLLNKFTTDTHSKLNPDVIRAFRRVLKDEHISYDDAATEIRTSPRRWEQLLLYISASMPVKNRAEAAALMSNVQANFQSDEHVSEMYKLVGRVVQVLLSTKRYGDLKNIKPLDPTEWRDALKHQIMIKARLGDTRTYMPLLQGLPGIGKTSFLSEISSELNMRLVSISCETLTQEEITGIPAPNEKGGQMQVKFAKPPLYTFIMDEMAAADEAFFANTDITDQEKQQYRTKKHKYIIFFDELNRVSSPNVFNSLRRVILTKKFTDQLSLPESCILIAAMNPKDTGVQPVTGHLRDAMDAIETAPSWSKLLEYITAKAKEFNDTIDSKQLSISIINEIVRTFAIRRNTEKISEDQRNFYLEIGGEPVYVSPREFSTMFLDLMAALNRVFTSNSYSGPEFIDQLSEKAVSRVKSTLLGVVENKYGIDSPQFVEALERAVHIAVSEYTENMARESNVSLQSILDATLDNPNEHLRDDANFLNYIDNFNVSKFSAELDNYFDHLVKKEDDVLDLVRKRTHSKKILQAKEIVIIDDLVDKVDFLMNEIMMAAVHHNLSNDVMDQMVNSFKTNLERMDELHVTSLEDAEYMQNRVVTLINDWAGLGAKWKQ